MGVAFSYTLSVDVLHISPKPKPVTIGTRLQYDISPNTHITVNSDKSI